MTKQSKYEAEFYEATVGGTWRGTDESWAPGQVVARAALDALPEDEKRHLIQRGVFVPTEIVAPETPDESDEPEPADEEGADDAPE